MSNPFDPPSLRNDLPLYPVHTQLIRVTGATVPGPSGTAQSSGIGSSRLAPPLYVAYVQQLMPSTLLPRDREPCLAADINGLGIGPDASGSVARFYVGRLAGTWTGLPVYEIIEPQTTAQSTVTSPIIHGKLNQILTKGGQTTMTIWENVSSETATSSSVTVYDWLLSTGQTIAAGIQVIAGYDTKSRKYYVIGAQCP